MKIETVPGGRQSTSYEPMEMASAYLHYDLASPALESFEERSKKIFQLDSPKTWIDVYSRPSEDNSWVISDNECNEENAYPGDELQKIQDVHDLDYYQDHAQPMFFIRFTRNSNSRLSPSQALFDGLLHKFSVNPRFKEFVMSFGQKNKEYDFAPPTCRFRFSKGDKAMKTKQYECLYGLRYVADNGNVDGKERWSVRQYAVYQRYDPSRSQNVWIFIGIPKRSSLERHIIAYTRRQDNSDPAQAFALHLTMIEASLVEWRWYLNDMTQRVQDQSDRITLADVAKDKVDGLPDFKIDFRDRQRLKTLEDSILNLHVMLESTIGTISSLTKHLSRVSGHRDEEESAFLINGYNEALDESKLYLAKAGVLDKRVHGASFLLSGLLDYENAYSLRLLAEEARQDNLAMRHLTEKATKDSGAIKIITIITVFFLPATVVAGFFSTQFVSIDPQGLTISKKWWIYFAITIPLTLVTLLIWYITSSTKFKTMALHRLEKARFLKHRDTDASNHDPEHAEMTRSINSVSSDVSDLRSPISPGISEMHFTGTPYLRRPI
ncbi:uncharacterized protein BDZ99DRAFT_574767 [Mytilinidion resinicola]|uniref:CorA-like transporter domain-containing protein n=1 Tax=Mytilinidion resinicola TaxID=574789 RepID=A0A6A6Y9C0_9PEZI|nr:uncharacterized protein BDZ99DRAFT_574767 [Mytilinidion resinicola]KAF2805158.1 hypothetical protein BDZ99DRAFT_574767 [Mytilinidion resinicola]